MMRRITSFLYGGVLALALAGGSLVAAGITAISAGAALPTNCAVGNLYIKTTATAGLYWCSTPGSPGTWSTVSSGGTGTVTNTGTLTSNALLAGNGGSDLKVATAAANSKLLGSGASGSGTAYSEITLGSGLSMSGTTLSATSTGGGLVLVEQHTASASASLDFTSCISSTYDTYFIQFVNIAPATNAVNLYMRVSTDGGATYIASGNPYTYDHLVFRGGGTGSGGSGGTTNQILLNFNGTTINNSVAQRSLRGWMYLYDPGSASLYKTVDGRVSYYDSGPFRVANEFFASYESTTAVNAFQFLASSGNIASGTIRCYGITK